MMKFTFCVCIAVFTNHVYSASVDVISNDIVLKNVDRTVDVSSQLVKIGAKITVENVGKTDVRNFLLAAEGSESAHLAYVGASDSSGRDLKISETNVASREGDKFWRVELRESLTAGSSVSYSVEYVYTSFLEPYPAEIPQNQHQLVRYSGNLYFYSPYRVITQRTTLALGTRHIESFTKTAPFSQSDTSIKYGPHENIAPFSKAPLKAHYRNNSPFLTIARLERWIEVSHWGNVAIEEHIEIVHSGARLKGAFSRYELQQEAGSGPASVRAYRTLLPAAAADVYYRDSNGNISTSALRVRRDAVELELRPRYPLLGGWRAHYTLGYNVPAYEVLWSRGDRFALRVRALDHVHDDMHVAELITRVVLPEGAREASLEAPYPVTRLPDQLHPTYLDTTGRLVLSFTKRNLVEQHMGEVVVRYTLPRWLLLQEPLLLVAALLALFLAVIVYVRLDFSIHDDRSRKE